jgi:hypothetical protein
VTYPVEETSKKAAALEFSRQFIGRHDSVLASLVEVVEAEEQDTEDEE